MAPFQSVIQIAASDYIQNYYRIFSLNQRVGLENKNLQKARCFFKS